LSSNAVPAKENQMNDLQDRMYPAQYIFEWETKTGLKISIRPIRPEDEPAMARFHESLSDRSVYLRYFHMEKLSSRVAHTRLARRCFVDYDSEMALVAEYYSPESRQKEIIGVGRLVCAPGKKEAEVALVVADKFQKCGIGSELLKHLIRVGRDEKLDRIVAVVLPENMGMRVLAARQGFKTIQTEDLSSVSLVLDLREAAA